MGRRTMPPVVGHLSLLTQSAIQNLIDDPALLAVQISRRMPFGLRVRTGRVLHAVARRLPQGDGVAALGAFMAGDLPQARALVLASSQKSSRMRGEVAVLLGRSDLVGEQAPARTRARAAWGCGDMSGAVAILEKAGLGGSAYARRLRSELALLRPGHRLRRPITLTACEDGAPLIGETERGLRVLHLITNSLPHTQSGYSLRTHRILTALAEQGVTSVALTRTGYPVMVGIATAADEDEIDGIRYRRTLPDRLGATPQARLEQEVAEALRAVEELRPHVIHATTDYRNALVAQAVSEATGIPWVLEVRGLMEQTWIASHGTEASRQEAAGSEKVRLIAAREGELARQADAVVTLSETMADVLAERGVPRERITLVPNGVDASLFECHVSAQQARAELGAPVPADAFAVGAVSALIDYEGFDVLLHAAAQLLHDEQVPSSLRERLHVVLAGEGVSRPSLASLAKELGIADRVIMPGRVPRQQARRWVEALDVVVVPRIDTSVTRSVTPQKPVEAMALGRPVIASDLPALRETGTVPEPFAGPGASKSEPPYVVPQEVCLFVEAGSPTALARAIRRKAVERPDTRSAAMASAAAAERRWPILAQRFLEVYGAVRGAGAGEVMAHGE